MTRPLTVIPWLLIAVIALIAYGSLYPFDFRADAFEGGVFRALTLLSWQRAGRGDRVANVLLYLPLGFCLFLWLGARLHPAARLIAATAAGACLSFTIEIAQFYLSVRVPSLTDLVLNSLGALIGALGGLVWAVLSGLMHGHSHAEKPARDPAAAWLVMLWLFWRFAPFIPQLDLGRLKSALQPLIRPHFEPVVVFVFLTCWLVVNQALATLFSRQRRLEALLILIAAVLIGRLIVANQAFVPSELLALLLLLPLVVVMHRMKPHPRRAVLVLAVAAVIIVRGLGPFDFAAPAAGFDLWPFRDWLTSGLTQTMRGTDWGGVFGALFLYAALTWVLGKWGASMSIAVAVTTILALAIEILQMWSPQQNAAITQPLLALGMALTVRSLSRGARLRSGFAGGLSGPRERTR